MPSFGNLPSVRLYLSKPNILPLRRLSRRGLDSAGGEKHPKASRNPRCGATIAGPKFREEPSPGARSRPEWRSRSWSPDSRPPEFRSTLLDRDLDDGTSQFATPPVNALEAEHAQCNWPAAEPSCPILGRQRCQTLNRSAIQEHGGVKVGLVRQPSNGGAQKI